MAKYKVKFTTDSITLEVDAMDEEEAEQLAWDEYSQLDQAEVETHAEVVAVK